MTRVSIFVVILLQSLGIAIANETFSSRPNIILCMADDQGWRDTGFNGHDFLQTPNLDRLASLGIRFDRWYAAAPVCSPTRGSCLTGRHPFRYGIYSANTGHLKSEEICIQEVLKKQGYATGHFGKWHLGTMTTKMKDANRGKPGATEHYAPPWDHGFDVCFSTESKVPTYDPMKIPGVGNGKSGKRNLGEDNLNKDYGTYYWTGQDQRVPQRELTGDDSMLIMKRATRFIEQCASDKKPFFAVIWFHAPHLPVVADEDHRNLYPRHPFGSLGKNYAGCLSALDDSMGLLHNELKRHSMFDNTMLWYCSDNGPESSSKKGPGRAEPFRGRKRDLYEGGVRVPGFVVWPHKIKKPFSTDVPCVTSDYFPTIHDVLGLDLPKRPYDGMSLLPLIEGRSKKRNRAIGFQSKKVQVWNDDRFKLVINKGKEELYDVANDLAESANLIEQHPEIAKNMKAEMMAWIESCKKSESGQDYRSGE